VENQPRDVNENPVDATPEVEATPHTPIATEPVPTPSEPVPTQPIASANPMMSYVLVAIVFLIVGAVMGVVGSNSMISREDIRTVIMELVEDGTLVQQSDLDTAIASIPASGGGSTSVVTTDGSSVDLSALVVQAIAENERQTAMSERNEIADDDPYIGDVNAPITIVEFSAYACPYCARHFQQTFAPLLENYGQYIRYVYRDFPVINQEVSTIASLAAQCANAQGKFWEYHDELFRNQQELAGGRDFFIQLASTLGLDTPTFTTCYDNQQYASEVTADLIAGDTLGITGTPAFYINGRMVSGALPYENFERIVLSELRKAGIDVEASTNSGS
jgi:protein-disulfide isomerase